MDTNIRQGKKAFYDDNKFPHGFGRSGDFTIKESDLLTRFGDTIISLEQGEQPVNDEEKRLMLVMQGQAEAQTPIEKAWVKYLKLARGKRNFFNVSSKNKSSEADDLSEGSSEPVSFTDED